MGMGFDSKCDFALPTICWGFSFALGCGFFFLVGSNILLLIVVQQQVVVLEFSKEKMITRPSTPPFLDFGEVMKIMVTSFTRPHAHTAVLSAPTLQQATTDALLPQRLLDTLRQVWVSLLWHHCSFLLGPGTHKILFVPSKNLFPLSCVSSGGSMVGSMVTLSKRAYATRRSAAPRAPPPAAGHC